MDLCDDQSEVIAFLSDPGNFGTPGPVERVDTHAAMIFLVGDHVYKLKQAVRYSYLDFSTSAKRKAVCEAELALNTRTAPDLYCKVEMIGRDTSGHLRLGQGQPVDWLVVMRRFRPDCLFDIMAREHRLTPELIRDLADRIAEFHTEAEPVHGAGAARLRSVINGNRASMAALPTGLLEAKACDELTRCGLAMLDELAPLLDRRAAAGQVRHCHGDLHLGNVCLWRGRPTLFDCLEFDPELATCDLLYDLAFLLMDLWQRGLHGEASLLFNRYCDMRNESDGLATLPLFLSIRATVRAHVEASAVARQSDQAKRQERLTVARDYLMAARTFLGRQRPRLIAVSGLSGSGKSTLAGRLAPLVGAAPGARWLRTDVLRKRLAGVAPEARLPARAYTREATADVYNKLLDQARLALTTGETVIVDGVFADVGERDAIVHLAERHRVPFTGLWLEAPPETLRERVGARRGDASDADGAVVDHQLGYKIGKLDGWSRVAAAGPPEAVLACVMKRMGYST